MVAFSAPSSGASLTFTETVVAIGANGAVSLSVTANDTAGGYTVTADSLGNSGTAVSYSLSNSPPPIYTVFLPVMMNRVVHAPDLVVSQIVVTASGLQVEIRNQGTAATTEEFWVDLYISPDTAPTGVNQTWQTLGGEGVVWGVTGITLAPNASLSLSLSSPYFAPAHSSFSGAIPAGTVLYAQVDSANTNTTYGSVLENHEITGGAYNNILMRLVETPLALELSSAPAAAALLRASRLPAR